ncbi:MAG: hypothetical protein ACLRWP_13955 [Bilophila wadsworthia]
MAVSVRKPVLYAFGVVLCAGIIGGIWLWYRTHCVLITNDSRIEGTLVSVASRLSDRVVQVMVNEGDTVHKGRARAHRQPQRHGPQSQGRGRA